MKNSIFIHHTIYDDVYILGTLRRLFLALQCTSRSLQDEGTGRVAEAHRRCARIVPAHPARRTRCGSALRTAAVLGYVRSIRRRYNYTTTNRRAKTAVSRLY